MPRQEAGGWRALGLTLSAGRPVQFLTTPIDQITPIEKQAADVVLETWIYKVQDKIFDAVVTDRTVLDAGEIGYEGKNALFVIPGDQPEALGLDFWRSFLDPDVMEVITPDDGEAAAPHSACSLSICTMGSGADAKNTTRYFPPQCEATYDAAAGRSSSCKELIAMNDHWGGVGAIPGMVKNLKLNMTVSYVGYSKGVELIQDRVDRKMPALVYGWYPDAFYNKLLKDGTAKLLMLPFHNETEWAFMTKSDTWHTSQSAQYALENVASDWKADILRKFMRPGLGRYLRTFFSSVQLTNSEIADLILEEGKDADGNDDMTVAVCNWLAKEKAIWNKWLPETPCGMNQYRAANKGACIPCPAGQGRSEFDIEEMRCLPCEQTKTCDQPPDVVVGGAKEDSRIALIAVCSVIGALLVIALATYVYITRFSWAAKAPIFISYKHNMKEQALQVKEGLEARGFKVWIDEQIAPGQDWRSEISEAIQSSIAVVFLLTDKSIESKYCREELFFAAAYNKPIFTLIYDAKAFNALSGALKNILQRIQGIDFTTGSVADNTDKLATYISAFRSAVMRNYVGGAGVKEVDSLASKGSDDIMVQVDKHMFIVAGPGEEAVAQALYEGLQKSCFKCSLLLAPLKELPANYAIDQRYTVNTAGGEEGVDRLLHDAIEMKRCAAVVLLESIEAMENPRCVDAIFAAYEENKPIVRVSLRPLTKAKLSKYGSMAMMLNESHVVKGDVVGDTERSVRLILLSLLSEHSDTFYPLEGIHTKKRPSLSQGGGVRGSRTSVFKSIGAKRDLSDINVIIEEDGSEDEAPPGV